MNMKDDSVRQATELLAILAQGEAEVQAGKTVSQDKVFQRLQEYLQKERRKKRQFPN